MSVNRRQWWLRNARTLEGAAVDIAIDGGAVAAAVAEPDARAIDVEGRLVLPALVNAHDHLDFSVFPALGQPPYRSVYEWAADVGGSQTTDPRAQAAMAVPEVDRLFLGGIRNLLAGVVSVIHHGPFHRSLSRRECPVHVLERYQFAHSPGLTPALRKTYRSTDRRIPWFVHAGEGTDERAAGELSALSEANVLRHNAVIVHGVAFGEEDARVLAEAKACVVWCPESNRRLYGATAPVQRLRDAGVRLGLGSDSPASGVRDALSNLAAARAEGVFSDADLVRLATQDSGEVARLPVGGLAPGDRADLIVVESLDRLLSGERAAIQLVVREGRVLYGRPEWLSEGLPLRVDEAEYRIEPSLGARLATLLKGRARAGGASWLSGLDVPRSTAG